MTSRQVYTSKMSTPGSQVWVVFGVIGLAMLLVLITEVIWGPPELMLDAWVRGCEVVPPPHDYLDAALRYEGADPAADAQLAIRDGDRRLWGFGRRGRLIPGVDDDQSDWYANNFKVKTMYLSDDFNSDAERRFQDAFYRYTERYNNMVVSLCSR